MIPEMKELLWIWEIQDSRIRKRTVQENRIQDRAVRENRIQDRAVQENRIQDSRIPPNHLPPWFMYMSAERWDSRAYTVFRREAGYMRRLRRPEALWTAERQII